jgi:hypothetical protein
MEKRLQASRKKRETRSKSLSPLSRMEKRLERLRAARGE